MEANLFNLLHTSSIQEVKEQLEINEMVIKSYKKLGKTEVDPSMQDLLDIQKKLTERLTKLNEGL